MKKIKQFENGIKKIIHELVSVKERFPGVGTIRKDMKRSVSPCFDKFAVFKDMETKLQTIKPISGFLSENMAKREFAKLAVDGEVRIISREEANNLTQNFCPCANLYVSFIAKDKEGANSQIVQSIAKFWTVEKAMEEFAKIAVDGEVTILNRQEADELLLKLGEQPVPVMDFSDETEDVIPTEKDEKLIAFSQNLKKEEDKTHRGRPMFLINPNWRKKRQKNFFEPIKG